MASSDFLYVLLGLCYVWVCDWCYVPMFDLCVMSIVCMHPVKHLIIVMYSLWHIKSTP